MKILFLGCLLVLNLNLSAQNKVDFTGFDQKAEAFVSVTGNVLEVTRPTGNLEKGELLIDLEEGQPIF